MLRCCSVCLSADTDAEWTHRAVFIPEIRRGGVHYRGQVQLVTSLHPFQNLQCRWKHCILAQNGVQTAICLLTSLIIQNHTRRDDVLPSTQNLISTVNLYKEITAVYCVSHMKAVSTRDVIILQGWSMSARNTTLIKLVLCKEGYIYCFLLCLLPFSVST
jgi:hypothetical protein